MREGLQRFHPSSQVNEGILLPLMKEYTADMVEAALVGTFLGGLGIQSPANELVVETVSKVNDKQRSSIASYFAGRNLEVSLKNIERALEVIVPHEERKKSGTFYTPSDVVNYVIQETVARSPPSVTVCDPACGMGAFLTTATEKLSQMSGQTITETIEKNIFGVDSSSKSIERAKVMLTLLAIERGEDRKRISFNLVTADSLLLDWHKTFPTVFQNGGFDVVVGNPPYASIGQKDIRRYTGRFESLKDARRSNLYVLFTELLLAISRTTSSDSSLVLPLSIAYDESTSVSQLRQVMEGSGGELHFSFFDRSPDSLFGDAVKTRNCILVRRAGPMQKARVYTTHLLRWNSQDRSELFKNIKDQLISDSKVSIVSGIPKVSESIELQALAVLDSSGHKLSVRTFGGTDDVVQENFDQTGPEARSVYFYSTAYNWLPVFRKPPLSIDEEGHAYIPSSLKRFYCETSNEADFVYACLSSRVAFWYWVTNGDGFHLSLKFLARLPFSQSSFDGNNVRELSNLGRALWARVTKFPIYKVNAGKKIANYNMLQGYETIREIDRAIISQFDLGEGFEDFLTKRYLYHVGAGRSSFKNIEMLQKEA